MTTDVINSQETTPTAWKMTIEEALSIIEDLADGKEAEDYCKRCRQAIQEGQKLPPHARYTAYQIAEKYSEELRGHGIEIDPVPSLSDLIKADPTSLKDPDIQGWLGWLKKNDRLEYEIDLKEAKIKGRMLEALEDDIKQMQANDEKKRDDNVDLSWLTSKIQEKAEAIMTRGDPIQYILFEAQRSHAGDLDFQRATILAIAASNSLTGEGIQVGGTGGSGSGKTDAFMSIWHLIPEAPWKIFGSLSNLVLFYMDLPPGTLLYSDDVDWFQIGPIFKRSTGAFQDGYIHRTLTIDREPRELPIPSRLTWFVTSVDQASNDQEVSRLFPVSTDSSEEHQRMVSTEIGNRRARKERKREVDEGVLVARAIIWMIKNHDPFRVVIPKAKDSQWIRHDDFRGQERFWDTVEAFAILRFMQRTIDEDGWLVADDQDINDAIKLFDTDKVSHVTKLTPAELKMIEAMGVSKNYTQSDLVRLLGISQQAVSERVKSLKRTKYLVEIDLGGGRKAYSLNIDNDEIQTIKGSSLITVKGLKQAAGDITSDLQPTYNPLTGIPTTIEIDISRHIPVYLQPNEYKDKTGDFSSEEVGAKT
jgi:biotin operon repressor